MYATLLNGELDRYPLSMAQMRREFPQVIFAASPTASDLAIFGIVEILPADRPQYNANTHACDQGVPQLINDRWVEQWYVRPLTAEELKSRVPSVVSMRQARRALLQMGLLSFVETALAAIPDEVQKAGAAIDWEYGTELDRYYPLTQALALALGLTESQLDELFTLASTL